MDDLMMDYSRLRVCPNCNSAFTVVPNHEDMLFEGDCPFPHARPDFLQVPEWAALRLILKPKRVKKS